MSRSIVTRFASLIAIAVAVTSLAAAAPRAHEHSVVGTLQKVDGQTLTLQTEKGPETLTLAPSAKVTVGSKTATAAELSAQTGSRVKVRYMDKGGQKQADSVTVSTPKKPATAQAHK
jgi:hypothetical protein